MQDTDILLQRPHSYLSTARSSRFSTANMFSRFIHQTKLCSPFHLLIIRSLVSVTWFEIGSLFCAVAPSVNFLIFGRAVAGMGGAGSTFISGPVPFLDLTIYQFSSVSYPLLARSHVWRIAQNYLGMLYSLFQPPLLLLIVS